MTSWEQLSIFDSSTPEFSETFHQFEQYDLKNYIHDVETIGLKNTWDNICQFLLRHPNALSNLFDSKHISALYEIGLAIEDKLYKKKRGQYCTPSDVSLVMAQWLQQCEGNAVCDVACGTGNLILTYLDLIGHKKARKLISDGDLYLYDSDAVALKICRTLIAVKYGTDIVDSIHITTGDFLDRTIKLPNNSKVICNPPYFKIESIQKSWEQSTVLLDTKEFYSAFMEKVFSQAKSTVIITPFSFISGTKYFTLRNLMCKIGAGFIVSFDNVPGNIFRGKKHGIFNSNTSNSVRAAITVMRRDENKKGFKISPLIRFKNEERELLLTTQTLEKTLPCCYQVISKQNPCFKKIDKSLEKIFKIWTDKSKYKIKDFVSKSSESFLIDIPNTCRYYTTASSKKLDRVGSITINVYDEEVFNFIYCFVNSSFAYWWWRIFDGGITYPVNLLNNMPIPFNLLKDEDKKFFNSMANKMIKNESDFVITKMNAGSIQQNIKFPESYRMEINNRILKILGIDSNAEIFNVIHANKFFNTKE
ncbi:MAG: N-6 DNA methylase [Ruminococcaceae bacterium]|nr:N-6 DNA methylase [Oscillospiraceae bacterium]